MPRRGKGAIALLRVDLNALLSRVRQQLTECRNALEKGLRKQRLLEEMGEQIHSTMQRVERSVTENQQTIDRQLDQLDPRLRFLPEYRAKTKAILNSPGVQSAIAQGWADRDRTRREAERTEEAARELSSTVQELESEEYRLQSHAGLEDEALESVGLSLREELFAMARAGMEKLL
jgi:exonuclease VII large subunit